MAFSSKFSVLSFQMCPTVGKLPPLNWMASGCHRFSTRPSGGACTAWLLCTKPRCPLRQSRPSFFALLTKSLFVTVPFENFKIWWLDYVQLFLPKDGMKIVQKIGQENMKKRMWRITGTHTHKQTINYFFQARSYKLYVFWIIYKLMDFMDSYVQHDGFCQTLVQHERRHKSTSMSLYQHRWLDNFTKIQLGRQQDKGKLIARNANMILHQTIT